MAAGVVRGSGFTPDIGSTQKCPDRRKSEEAEKNNGRPGEGSPVERGLLAQVELFEELAVLGEVVSLHVIEQFTTAGSHLQQTAATVKVLAVGAEVLGQVIDPSGENRDLDFGGSGIFIVSFELSDDFWFSDGRHWLLIRLHNCRGLWGPRDLRLRHGANRNVSRNHRSNPAGAGPVMVAPRNRRDDTNARGDVRKKGISEQALF